MNKKSILTVISLLAMPVIIMWEGHSNQAYRDVVNVWTICSGETHNVYQGQYMTDEQCKELTLSRVQEFANAIDQMVMVQISPGTHAALTSWAYNVGINAARKSTLIRKLNSGDYAGACAELKRWNKAGGQTLQGLINRREYEYQMCLDGL